MPLDGTGYEGRIQALDKMDKVIDLLSDERRWCKGFLKTRDGRYCILGALQAAESEKELAEPIMLAIMQVTGRKRWIHRFNDDPLTTHALVVKVLQQARENVLTVSPAVPQERVGAWARLWSVFLLGSNKRAHHAARAGSRGRRTPPGRNARHGPRDK